MYSGVFLAVFLAVLSVLDEFMCIRWIVLGTKLSVLGAKLCAPRAKLFLFMCIYVYLSAQIPKYTYTLLHIITHVPPPTYALILVNVYDGYANY